MGRRPYRRILVPTDGSHRARRAARVAAALARKTHARLVAACVVVEHVPTAFDPGLYASPAIAPKLQHLLAKQADAALQAVEREAKHYRVACERHRLHGSKAWKSIIGAARRFGCDLIVMGSRGREAVAATLLGSTTARVLAHSRTPVLVCR